MQWTAKFCTQSSMISVQSLTYFNYPTLPKSFQLIKLTYSGNVRAMPDAIMIDEIQEAQIQGWEECLSFLAGTQIIFVWEYGSWKTSPHLIVSFDFAGYQPHKDATALGVLRYVNKKVFEEILRGIIKIHLLVRTKTK